MDTAALVRRFRRDGFLSPVYLVSPEDAAAHLRIMEKFEAILGPLHYKSKAHKPINSAYLLATTPKLLDIVELLIGPNILLRDVTYIVKEAHTKTYASWHQDLAYRFCSTDDTVAAWIALSPATEANGCMRMVPGSHLNGRLHHESGSPENNLLSQGQLVPGVDESQARFCNLNPGQLSLHHGWTLHASGPNTTDARRIGLVVQFFATHVVEERPNGEKVGAKLVRGTDRYGHYLVDNVRW